MSHSFKDLLAWQKARKIVHVTYRLTDRFPQSEIFGLTSQMRRAAVSVASNIAEGQGRLTRGEFIHFLGIARGSLIELQTQAVLACDLAFISADQLDRFERMIGDVLGLLNRLIESLRPAGVAAQAAS